MQASSLDVRVRRLFAAVTVVMLSVLIIGCDGGLMGTDTQSDISSKALQPQAKAQAQQGAAVETQNVVLGIKPEDTDNVPSSNWSDLWSSLTWEPAPPSQFDGGVALWGALVIDGERQKSFLVEFQRDSGGNLVEIGDAGLRPTDMLPGTEWVPGTEWRSGEELTNGNALPPAAAFFPGTKWFPQQRPRDPKATFGNFTTYPRNWAVNGIIDGIFEPGEKDQSRAQLLIQPILLNSSSGVEEPGATAGIVVQFKEKEAE